MSNTTIHPQSDPNSDIQLDSSLDIKTDVLQAAQRIHPYVRETPLDYSPVLSHMADAQVFLKLENLQDTGSFKLRGAMNKLLTLTPEQRSQGIVTASSGNHGAAVAFGISKLQIPGLIFVPETASSTKVQAIRQFGANVQFYGTDAADTEHHAFTYANHHGMVYVAPYNDRQVLSGQGTIALEIIRQAPTLDAVFVSVGGGGLISGIAGYLKAVNPSIQIIGCSPENSPVMAASIKAGHIVEMTSHPTLSDGTAGGIEPNAITFDICRRLVNDFVLVSEADIAAAMRWMMETHHQLIEGAAGVAIAAFLQTKEQFRHQTVAIVICGANISLQTLKSIL
jgi:threonine dehydratase